MSFQMDHFHPNDCFCAPNDPRLWARLFVLKETYVRWTQHVSGTDGLPMPWLCSLGTCRGHLFLIDVTEDVTQVLQVGY